MPTTRELASAILLAGVALLVVLIPSWRRSVLPSARVVARSFFQWTILRVFGGFLLWNALWVWLAWQIGIWNLDLLTDTAVLVFGLGFPLLFRSIRAKSGAEIARHIRRETLTLSALFLFYLNLESLPLWGELISQTFIAFIAVLAAVAGRDAKTRSLAGCLSVLLVLATVGLVIWTTVQTISNWGDLNHRVLILQLALSIWLPFAMFPYLYLVAFYAATEVILKRLVWMNTDMPLPARLGVLVGIRLSVRWAKALTGRYGDIGRAKTFRGALLAMSKFRDEVSRRESREVQRVEDLAGFAGQVGADGSGAQLDRREFDGTKRALRFIHTAQALRFERLGERFWDDLTDMVINPASRFELPDDHGIVVQTTPDAKSWRAWRRLPSGWVLGIGATGRFGEYLFAGAEAPVTWPGEGDDWVDSSRALGPRDWERDDGPRM